MIAAAAALAVGAVLGWAWGVPGAVLAAGAVAAVRRWGPGAGSVPWACAALALAAGWRGASAAGHRPRGEALAWEALDGSRRRSTEPLLGRWWPLGSGGGGWLEPAEGDLALRLELDAPPAPGSWIVLLGGVEALRWAGGPVPGPLGRAGRHWGLARVDPDQWIQKRPPARVCDLSGQLSAQARPLMEWLRSALARRLGAYEARSDLGQDSTYGLGRALLLGHRSALDRGLVDLFTRTGTRHLLAVSGLHVGLLAGFAAWWFGRRRAGPGASPWPARAVLAVLGLWVYAGLAGGAPPVARASIMLALALLGPTPLGAGRRPDALSLLAAAYVVEAVFDPGAPLSPGVQLSYLATAGLVLAPRGRARRAQALGPTGWGRAWGTRWGRAADAAARASVAANLATLPVVASLFGEWSPWGLVLTPLALPWIALLLLGYGLALVLPEVLPTMVTDLPGSLLVALLTLGDDLPGTPWRLPERPSWCLAAWCLGAFALWRGRRGLGRGVALGAGALLLPWSPTPGGLEVLLLDVGHGTCALVRAPGLGTVVLDAGSRDRPRLVSEALGPLLARWDPGRLGVVISHRHADHTSALGWLLDRYPPTWVGGAISAQWGARFAHRGWAVDPAAGRADLHHGDLTLSLLRGLEAPGNEGSRGLWVSAAGATVVLLGDAEGPGLGALLGGGLPRGPVDLLLLPHHGSDTDLLVPLVRHLEPARIWVSAGSRPPVAAELDRRGLCWNRTGLEGACFLHFQAPRYAP